MQTFRDFMEEALYDPAGGFYNRREPTADFYTAPELHPAFAGVLARDLAKRFERLRAGGRREPLTLVEMGSGRGVLAGQILDALKSSHPGLAQDLRLVLVERCREELSASVLRLSARHPGVVGHTRLEEVLPFEGVLLSNELVDAFPVHLLEKRGGRVLEVNVEDGRAVLGEPSTPELARAAGSVRLEEGERHAVNLEARDWLEAVSARLRRGWILTVDYGKRFGGAPNPPRAFFKHSVSDEVLARKGGQDLTASVDFDALIEEGARRGLDLESYTTLSRYLIDGGVADWLEAASVKDRQKIKTLIHPEGMGETFKVLIQRRTELSS